MTRRFELLVRWGNRSASAYFFAYFFPARLRGAEAFFVAFLDRLFVDCFLVPDFVAAAFLDVFDLEPFDFDVLRFVVVLFDEDRARLENPFSSFARASGGVPGNRISLSAF